ncbi:leucine-, isoleucine-, valine-, threonine-, and alanine-binding protein precursor [Anaerotignum neopropionicum]|uniref:Leucine-, isoleucine-, valine-, threonine-, and alanine-binding protein n=1 Tax=Anaerotignum neopropionicum TaxID=36847 RepID=A0A136WD28_9FIRM|nr:ABC transporter substrate-binding protein [Anaerotignum neopropionicum]KXL52417.1 leucine-, isoleucine-, valine-, threonine-, and alanine-binding protein precursor [Anaerotignum neopropionicum]
MKKNVFAKMGCTILSLVLTAAMVTGCSSSKSSSDGGKEESAEIVIGGVFPLTGDIPGIGSAMENGAKLAVADINAAGGVLGKTLKLISEDDQNQASVAPNAISKLIDQDKVAGVVGTYASSCSIPMATIAKERGIPMISIASTNEKVTQEGGGYVFRACFIDPLQGKVGAQFALQKLSAAKAAMLYDKSQDYCVGIADKFKTNFNEGGGEVVFDETYNRGDSDFKALLTKIAGLNVDVLYLPDNYSTVGLIAKQARELGITCAILGSDSWSDPGLVTVGGSAVEGCYFTDHVSFETDNPKVKEFAEKYKSQFGSEPSGFSVLSYEAVLLMANAIEKAGSTDSSAIVDALKATDMEGLASNYKFDSDNNPIKSVVINQVKDGKFVFAEEIQPE